MFDAAGLAGPLPEGPARSTSRGRGPRAAAHGGVRARPRSQPEGATPPVGEPPLGGGAEGSAGAVRRFVGVAGDPTSRRALTARADAAGRGGRRGALGSGARVRRARAWATGVGWGAAGARGGRPGERPPPVSVAAAAREGRGRRFGARTARACRLPRVLARPLPEPSPGVRLARCTAPRARGDWRPRPVRRASCRSGSAEVMKSCQISAGKVPPSTGPPLKSVVIGTSLSG